jgi:hypothetical protein
MIIIYNISGLLVGLLGAVLGFLVLSGLVVVGSPVFLSPGFLAIAAVWCALGRAKPNFETGEMRPAPAVFFIPLFYWGLVIGILSLPVAGFEIFVAPQAKQVAADQAAKDPRVNQFKELEDDLSRNRSDDEALSGALMAMIAKMLPGEPVNVAIKSSDSRVLVLMKLKDLKKIKEPDRKTLLKGIREVAEAQRPGVQVYAGIKGRLMFGAITAPGQPDLVGSVVEERNLFAFFDAPPATTADSSTERPESPSIETKSESATDLTSPKNENQPD